jgi:hypothetical protein
VPFEDQERKYRDAYGLHPHTDDGPWTVLIQFTSLNYVTVVIHVKETCASRHHQADSGLPFAVLPSVLREFFESHVFLTCGGQNEQGTLDNTFPDFPQLDLMEVQQIARDVKLEGRGVEGRRNVMGLKSAIIWAMGGNPKSDEIPPWMKAFPDPIKALKPKKKKKGEKDKREDRGQPHLIPVVFLDLTREKLDYAAMDSLWTMYVIQVMCMVYAPLENKWGAQFEECLRGVACFPQVSIYGWPQPTARAEQFIKDHQGVITDVARKSHAATVTRHDCFWTVGWDKFFSESHLVLLKHLAKPTEPRWDPDEVNSISLEVIHEVVARWVVFELRTLMDGVQGRAPRDFAGTTDTRLQCPLDGLFEGSYGNRAQRRKMAKRGAAMRRLQGPAPTPQQVQRHERGPQAGRPPAGMSRRLIILHK